MSVIEVTLRKILKMNIYGIEGGFYLNRKIQIPQKPPFHPISNKTIWRRHCRVIFNSRRKNAMLPIDPDTLLIDPNQ